MEFYDFPTQCAVTRKHESNLSVDQFYKTVISYWASLPNIPAFSIELNIALCEQMWYKHGCTYFKIHKHMVNLLADVRMDVPVQLVHLPVPCFCVRLPVGHGLEYLTVQGHELRSFLFYEMSAPSLDHPDRQSRMVCAWMDFGETMGHLSHGVPFAYPESAIATFIKMHTYDGDTRTIDECINRETPMGSDGRVCDMGLPVTVEMAEICFRLGIGISFLATGADRLVEYDVLNKDLDRYLDSLRRGDGVSAQRLRDKASRRGKKGYVVGREIYFPGRAYTSDSQSEPTGRKLTHSHLRRAHFHTVPYGPQKSLRRVQFYHSIVVKPDLPPQEKKRGYTTRQD